MEDRFFRQSLRKDYFREYIKAILSSEKQEFTVKELEVDIARVKKAHYEAIEKGFLSNLGYTTVEYRNRVRGRVKRWKLKSHLCRIAIQESGINS